MKSNRVLQTILRVKAAPPLRRISLPCFLLLYGMSLALAGCGSAHEKSVSADQPKQTTPVAIQGGSPLEPAREPSPLIIPSGTAIQVRLLNSLSSRTASRGEEFEAQLAAPINADGSIVFPSRTRVRGRVVSASPSGGLHHPGYLRLTLQSIQTLSGDWMPISTSFVSARGKSHKRRNLTLIGGGAGLGGLIGGLAGGGKGLAIGAVSGAAAGTAGAYFSGKKEAVLPAETKLTFATVKEMAMNR